VGEGGEGEEEEEGGEERGGGLRCACIRMRDKTTTYNIKFVHDCTLYNTLCCYE